jgi:hypothetical protein
MAQVKDFQIGADGDGLTVSTINATTATFGTLIASFGAVTATSLNVSGGSVLASASISGTLTTATAIITTATISGATTGTTATFDPVITDRVLEKTSAAGVTIDGLLLKDGGVKDVTFDGSFTETVFAISDGASVDLDPANGTIQTWTLGANRSPTATNFAAGQSMTLMVLDGTAYTITWPSVTWVGGSAPALDTTKYTVIELWKVSTTLYGALIGFA